MSQKHSLGYRAPARTKLHTQVDKEVPHDYYSTVFHSSLMRGPFKEVSGHGTIPTIIGAAVAATGHSQMLVRSLAVVICAVWLSLDVGVWLSKTKWSKQWKGIAFCISSSFLCCLAMGIMYWFLASTLEDQHNETFQHLTANHYLVPGEEDDPMHTMFSVTNGGSYEISEKHGITCLTNLAVGNGGASVQGMFSWVADGKVHISGGIHTFGLPPAATTLLPGGDAQTDQCLNWWKFAKGTDCADITLIFWYSLESQPDVQREKSFRFVAYKGKNGQFSWYAEPQSLQGSYCTGALVKPGLAP
jgi:hypothetical protein